ncbi:hypothetical protein [Streptomyces sp. G45]|uniref:hypothetical protein n=1 Tax=Streptomyces sp. G45 TaxID=3406627 RepID=UPI003C1909F4
MTEIPEEKQAAALRAVAEAGARRAELLKEADRILHDEVRPRAIEAVRLGAGRNRTRELAGVGPSTLYGWLEDEGVPVRPKRPAPRKKKGKTVTEETYNARHRAHVRASQEFVRKHPDWDPWAAERRQIHEEHDRYVGVRVPQILLAVEGSDPLTA